MLAKEGDGRALRFAQQVIRARQQHRHGTAGRHGYSVGVGGVFEMIGRQCVMTCGQRAAVQGRKLFSMNFHRQAESLSGSENPFDLFR